MGTDEIAMDKSNEIFATWKNSSSITGPSRSWGSDHGASLHGLSQWWLIHKLIPSTGPSVLWAEIDLEDQVSFVNSRMNEKSCHKKKCCR